METRLTLSCFALLLALRWGGCYYYPPANGLQFCSQSEISLPATLYMTHTKNQYGYRNYHGNNHYGYPIPVSQRQEGECQVTFRPYKSLRVKLEYKAFNMDSCWEGYYREYIEIRNDQKSCGNRTGESNLYEVSQANPLSIKYKWTSYSSGFIITLTEVEQLDICSTYADNLLLPARVASPGYPNMIQSYRNCEINLSIPKDSPRIQIKFLKFNLDESLSCSRHSFLVGNSRYCQNLTGEVRFEDGLSSTVSVKFKSDGSVSAEGFLVEISSVPNFCNRRWSAGDLPANISSPGYPSLYPNNLNCQIEINTSGWPRMALRFISFELEADRNSNCKFDYLEVGHDRFCGIHDGKKWEINTQDRSSIIFKLFTDNSVQKTGFQMELSFINAEDVCQKRNITLPAYIRSPNFPQPYPNQQSCEATIWSPSDVLVEFVEFSLEDGSDFLYIGDESFTGLISKKSVVIRSGEFLPIKFATDKTINMKGFWMKVTPKEDPLTKPILTSTLQSKISMTTISAHTVSSSYFSAATTSSTILMSSTMEEKTIKTTPSATTQPLAMLSSTSPDSYSHASSPVNVSHQISSSTELHEDSEHQSASTAYRLESSTFSSTKAEQVSTAADKSEEGTETYSHTNADELTTLERTTIVNLINSSLPQSDGCNNCSSSNRSITPLVAVTTERISASPGISLKQEENVAVSFEEMVDRKLAGMSSTSVSFYFIGFFSACLIFAVVVFILVRRLRAKERRAVATVKKDADENAYVIQ